MRRLLLAREHLLLNGDDGQHTQLAGVGADGFDADAQYVAFTREHH